MSTQKPFGSKDLLRVIAVDLPRPIHPPYFPDAIGDTLYWYQLPQDAPVKFDYPGHSGLAGLRELEVVLLYNNNDWHKQSFPGLEQQPPFRVDDTINKNRLTGNDVTVECIMRLHFADRIEELRNMKRRYEISDDEEPTDAD